MIKSMLTLAGILTLGYSSIVGAQENNFNVGDKMPKFKKQLEITELAIEGSRVVSRAYNLNDESLIFNYADAKYLKCNDNQNKDPFYVFSPDENISLLDNMDELGHNVLHPFCQERFKLEL